MVNVLTHRLLDHVAIVVHSIEESASLFELLTGESCSQPEILEAHGVRVAFVGSIELVQPIVDDSPAGRFFRRRGQALHHIAYRTEDLEGELSRLEEAGLRLIDREPRTGAKGHRVAFIHPSSTGGVLVELVQHAS